ncbi:MAG: hypothetical protein WC100_07000 [Sterolibacterium sp.]
MTVTFVDYNEVQAPGSTSGNSLSAPAIANLVQIANSEALLQELADQVAADAAAAQAAAAGAVAVTGLSAIGAESRAIALRSGATAAFIYDTRLDSDGGAWRFKTQDRSWYVELGQFPQRTLWAAFGTTTSKVIAIFNLDDPKCPVYMLFSGNSGNGMLSSGDASIKFISVKNGHICFAGSDGGLVWLDLIHDKCITTRLGYIVAGPLSNRNNTSAANRLLAGSYVGALASNTTYAVSLAVLPGTPGNPSRFNLPDPLILVGTASGMSVVQLDGSTVNSASSTTINYGHIVSDGVVFQIISLADPTIRACRLGDLLQASFTSTSEASLASSAFPFALYGAAAAKIAARPFGFSTSRDKGVVHAIWDRVRPERSLLCRQQSNVITGFMCGASDFALQANSAYTGAAAAGTDLVTNGDFASDLTGWTLTQPGSSTVTWVAGVATLTRVGADIPRLHQSFSTTIGKAYRVEAVTTGTIAVYIGTSAFTTTNLITTGGGAGTKHANFIATATTTYITINALATGVSTVDDVVIKEVIGDFSKDPNIAWAVPNTNDFDIVGSLNRTAIQSGCDVYGFSGFSTSNYLQSINTLTGPGTGDFHMQAVFSGAVSGAIQTIFEWADSPYSGAGIRLYLDAAGALVGQTTANGFSSSTTVTSPQDDYGDGFPHTVALIRSGGYLQLWVDGRRVIMAASSETLTNGSAIFVIGVNALISASAATAITIGMMRGHMTAAPDQALIPQAQREELEVCQANVASLLPAGTVNDISGDAMTGAVAVATTVGACVLRGLAKTASHTALTATNKFPNPNFPKTSPTATLPDGFVATPVSGITISHVGSGVAANGEAYVDLRFSGTPGATGSNQVYFAPVLNISAVSGQTWFMNSDVAMTAGAKTNLTALNLRLVTFTSVGGFIGFPLVQDILSPVNSTLTRQAGSSVLLSGGTIAYITPAIGVSVTSGQAIDITIRISRIFIGQGASEPATYLPGFSNSSNSLIAAINDNDLFIASANGLDALVTAQTLRSRIMRQLQRRIPPSIFKCQTTGATATRAWQFPVLEGQSFMVEAELSARQVGGVITEYARYRLRAICKRDFGGNVVVQNVTTTDYEVTSSMDAAFTADTTNQTIYLSVTGKATTNLVWVGEPKITLLNPQLAA